MNARAIKKIILLLLSFFFSLDSNCQIIVFEDIFKGGVCVTGASTADGSGSFSIPYYIEPLSTIKKVFLITYNTSNETSQTSNYYPIINGDIYPQNFTDNITVFMESGISPNIFNGHYAHITDITEEITFSSGIVLIDWISQISPANCPSCIYSAPSLIILYENNSMPTLSYSLIINNNKEFLNNQVNIQINNPFDSTVDIGFGILSDRLSGNLMDGYNIGLNGNFIGVINQTDITSLGSGVMGTFYYQNDILFGLTDDTPDGFVGNADGLVLLNTHLISTTDFNVSWDYQQLPTILHNSLIGFNLTYTTTCDTFSVTTIPDTTICIGETLQLFATGGTSTGAAPAYEWLPATDLSCSDCPNPIFTGDSSRFYTVRIWNNDSCSVVRPVKVIVRPKPQFGAITAIPTICGANTGQVTLSAVSGTQTPLTYSMNSAVPQSSGTFSSLFEGTYIFTLIDGFGCTNDSTVALGQNNPTSAQFSLDPTIGTVPLTVSVSNTSLFATNYSWWLNGIDQGNSLSSFVCDPSGTYTVELIAWQFDPSCADTFALSVLALDRLLVPTAFTPDNDGVNDTWELPNIDAIYPKNTVHIFDRWGALIYETEEGKYTGNEWDGAFEGKAMPVGSYYFMIELHVEGVEDLKGVVSVVLE